MSILKFNSSGSNQECQHLNAQAPCLLISSSASQRAFKVKVDKFCEIRGVSESSWLSVSASEIVFIRTSDSFKLGMLVVGLKYHKQTLFLGKLPFLLISFFCYFKLSKLSLFSEGAQKFLFLVKELSKIRFRKFTV